MICCRSAVRSVLSVLIALLFLLTSGINSFPAEAQAAQEEDLTLYIAADPHYIAPSLTDNGAAFTSVVENADGKYMLRCEELTDAFLSQVLRDQPDVLLLPGDLTFNGARESHRQLAEKLSLIREAGIQVLVMPGNHDLNCPMAASFQGERFSIVPSIDSEEFREIYADFGYSDAVSQDRNSLSYIAELSPDCWALIVDVNTPEAPGFLTDETLLWVRQQLQEAARLNRQVVAVSHQPLLDHSNLFYGVSIGGGERLLALYEGYGVLCNLSGHMHIQHILQSSISFPDIAGSSLITWPNQFGVLTLSGDAVDYRTERVDTSALQDFEGEALRFLQETNRRQVASQLSELGISDEDHALRDYLVSANLCYVAGRCDLVDPGSPLYERWLAIPGLLSYYLRSICEDGANHTALHFSTPVSTGTE